MQPMLSCMLSETSDMLLDVALKASVDIVDLSVGAGSIGATENSDLCIQNIQVKDVMYPIYSLHRMDYFDSVEEQKCDLENILEKLCTLFRGAYLLHLA